MWDLLPAAVMLATISAIILEGCYVLYFKHMSRHTNAANTVDDATMATFSQPKHQQVHVAASKGERQEHADKLQHQHEKGTGSAEDSAVVQPYVDSSKPLETIKAARSPSPKRQPVGDNGKSRVNDRKEGENGQKASIKTSAPTKTAHKASKSKGKSLNANSAGGRQSTNSKTTFINNKAAGNTSSKAQHKPVAVDTTVNWHDGYLAAVRALLGKAVDASNQGCTAHAGLQSFQVSMGLAGAFLSGSHTTWCNSRQWC
ncbi:hypothetical protein WJX79_006227 [Trebouxia sp. C0005]